VHEGLKVQKGKGSIVKQTPARYPGSEEAGKAQSEYVKDLALGIYTIVHFRVFQSARISVRIPLFRVRLILSPRTYVSFFCFDKQ